MGKTRNCRMTGDEKRIHRAAVEFRKRTDSQIFEYIEGEKENARKAVIEEYRAVFDELIRPVFESVDYEFTGCPKDFGDCIKTMQTDGIMYSAQWLVDYIKQRMADDFPDGIPKMIVHVVSETEVKLISQFNRDMDRWDIVDVQARIPAIKFNTFIDQESFIIQMQSMFLDTPDKAVVMQVAGNVEDKTVANYGDDGVSQKATIKTGLANVEDVIVPNPVTLKPFRTFCEVGQQEVEFVFRMKNGNGGVSCALFEADGGAWKFRAVHEIADFLKNELIDVEGIAVLA